MPADLLYSAVVNQKLAFARIELAAAAAGEADDINARLARHAHLDSAIAQISDALCYFIAEVGEQYNIVLDPSWKDPAGLLSAFAETGRPSAQIGELLSLRKKPDSWLAELLRASSDPMFLARRFKPSGEQNQTGIALVDVTENPQEAPQGPLELVTEWTRAAQSLVDRQRASMHEE